ncbi:molybdenum cofactor guanylyltransferase [Campylobacter sp. US33a]|uniref:molybdenum cofactor guanylyltransferase n=1 Tax=Campylobacter sp. US33a TaxID=2498120 RepID=UPI001068A296|nr:molybdenum cofactor guanylyltransferase [Campylobacter sp. US33a]TEY02758.1 molybdenum cofactor guanylyltransferase [Campylobacter sp. US33a]
MLKNCVILCGGKSSRMGQDKSLLKIGSKNLTQIQVEKFSKFFEYVFVSAKNDKFNKEFKIIQDDLNYPLHSPMLALYSILKNFKNEFVFIISVDSPCIGLEEISKMAEFLEQDYKIIIAKSKNYKHSLCGFYHSDLADVCKNLLDQNEQKIQLLFSKVKTKFVEFEDEKPFLNLNFYDEFQKYKSECE